MTPERALTIPYIEGMLGGIRWDTGDHTVVPALLEANARATLALVEQQKIANRIELAKLCLAGEGRVVVSEVGIFDNPESEHSWFQVKPEIQEALL